jgi:hypothetical protein
MWSSTPVAPAAGHGIRYRAPASSRACTSCACRVGDRDVALAEASR